MAIDADIEAEIDRLIGLASPGPWSAHEGDTDAIEIRGSDGALVWFDVLHEDDEANTQQRRNINAIVWARNAYPMLRAEIMQLRAENERLRAGDR